MVSGRRSHAHNDERILRSRASGPSRQGTAVRRSVLRQHVLGGSDNSSAVRGQRARHGAGTSLGGKLHYQRATVHLHGSSNSSSSSGGGGDGC